MNAMASTKRGPEMWLFAFTVVNFVIFVAVSININENEREREHETPELQQLEQVAKETQPLKKTTPKFKFGDAIYEVTIRDDVLEGTNILTTTASFKKKKLQKRKTLNYRLKDKQLRKATSDVFPFSVEKATGDVTVTGPISNVTDQYEFKVEAYITGNKKASQKTTVIVYIDHTPIHFSFSANLYQGFIEENIYGDVNVTLELIGIDDEEEASPRYSLYEVVPEVYPSRFGVDPFSGAIFVRYPLDREDVEVYYVTITAELDGNSDQAMVMVRVIDQNDNPPLFPYDQLRMQVYENVNLTLAGSTFVSTYDEDTGPNADITYSILSGGMGMIRIDPKKGQLYNTVDLDYEKVRRFKLVIAASSGLLRSTCKVYLFIRDVNDNPPIVNDFEVFYNGRPNTLGGAEVARIPVRDPDETGLIRFGMLTDDDEHMTRGTLDREYIEVDPNTGMIRISPRIQHVPDIDVEIDVGVYAFDGLHASSARCKITMTGITEQMVANSVSAHILNVTENQFLTEGGLKSVRNATRDLLGASSVTIFNIEEFEGPENSFINVSFSAKKSNGIFFSPVEILNAIYFQKDMMETMCGFHISPAEEDTCVSEMCNNHQRCVTRKTLASTQVSYEAHLGDIFLRFFGIPPLVEHWCECLDTARDGNCSDNNPCDSKPCMNKGMCYEEEGGFGYGCICPKDYTGVNCESPVIEQTCFPGACGPDEVCENLSTGSFHCVCKRASGCPNENTWYFPKGAYLAFPSLTRKTTMKISLQFSTHRNSGLLLYLGRYSFMYDFLALEIIRNEVALTFNVGRFIMRVKVGTPGGVNDGKWHMVELKYHEKVVEVILDECNEELYEHSDHTCAAYATQALDVTTWFLDVNTPFILGSIPVQDGDSRIINNDFEGCIKDVHINNRLHTAGDVIRRKDTEQGCPWYKQRPELPVNDGTF